MSSGLVQCWGDNAAGELGIGSFANIGYSSSTPAYNGLVTLPGNGTYGGTASAIVAGGQHTCALVNSVGLLCWGDNSTGALGTANTNDLGGGSGEATPAGTDGTPVIAPIAFGGPTAFKLALGYSHTCALLSDGNVRCWGDNTYAELGLGFESVTPTYILLPNQTEHAAIFEPSVTPAPPSVTGATP